MAVAASATGWDGDGVPGFRTGGQVDLSAIEDAMPGLEKGAADLEAAAQQMGGIDTGHLVWPLADAIDEATTTLDEQTHLVVTARDLGRLLPGMLGADGHRRYFLAFQNLSAPRGTGGFLGLYGVLDAQDGHSTLTALQPIGTVPRVKPVPVPEEVQRRYGSKGVATTMWSSNYPPDVPTSSQIALEIGREAGLGEFDGVIWTDTVWMADVLKAVGPVDSSAWPEPLTGDNLVDVANRQVFEGDDATASDAAQAQIGLDVWTALLTRTPQPEPLAAAMSRGTREGHLMVFSTDPEDQQALDALGATGEFTLGPNPLAVIWQDASASRAGYFAERDVAASVRLDGEGDARAETVVTLHNGAPDGPPSILLGVPGEGVPVGWWGADVEIYLPADARNADVRVNRPSVYSVGTAYEHKVAGAFLYAGPGGDCTATAVYRQAAAATQVDGTWEYRVQVRPQVALRPIPYSLDVTLPEGAQVLETSPGVTVSGTSVQWSGSPVVPEDVWVRYSLGD